MEERSRAAERVAGRRLGLAAEALLALALLLTPAALARDAVAAASCDLHGASAVSGHSRVTIERLETRGLGCDTAAGLAREAARELASGQPITFANVSMLDVISSTRCAGCAAQTDVTATFPSGSMTVVLRGGAESGARMPGLTVPGFPGFPRLPVVPPLPRFPGFPRWPSSGAGAGGNTLV